jgi:oligoendopeptidase F
MAQVAERSLPRRADVPVEQTWDLESVFPSPDAFEQEYQRLSAWLDDYAQYQGRLGESPATLLAALNLHNDFSEAADRLIVYGMLRRAEDAVSSMNNEIADRVSAFAARAGAASAFLRPEILAVGEETISQFLDTEPGLAVYRAWLDDLFRLAHHTRSPEVEALLAEVEDVAGGFYTVFTALDNADLDLGQIQDQHGLPIQLEQGNLLEYIGHGSRAVREAAWTSSRDAYLEMEHTYAASLVGGMKRDILFARARRFDSALEASLAPNNVPVEVFHNLLATVQHNLPTWRRYFQVRQRILGVDQHQEWDVFAPLTTDHPKISWDEAVRISTESLSPLGEEYVAATRRGIEERWVDRCGNLGKGGGAFSSGTKGTHPFISMVYQDNFESVSTLAHELGHSLHSYLTWQSQPALLANYGMIAAETASNMHQALMGAYLRQQAADPAFEIAMLEERMSNFHRYFLTMPLLARFELECHTRLERGDALSAETMNGIMADLYEEAYDGVMPVDRERHGITWATFPHLYMNYYVFQYAIGIAAAAQLSQQVLSEGEPATQRYLRFLRSGSSGYEIDLLREAGVDMRDPAPVQAAFDQLAGYVERLDELTR